MTPAIATPRFAFYRSVFALMLREMSTTYGRSPGGYIWAFAEPIAGIAVLSFAFSLFTRTPALGYNFPLYYASGLMPLTVYTSTSSNLSNAIRFSRALLAYPRVTYVDALIARFLLNALTQILITISVIGGIILVYGLKVNIDYFDCARAMAMALALGVGVGTVNCYLMSMFPLWRFIWAVLTRPLFIISGIFFLIDAMPESLRTPLLFNPVAHPIMMMRRGLYPTYEAAFVSESYVYLVALSLSAVGMLLLHRHHRTIMDVGS